MNDQRRRDEDFVQSILQQTSGSACQRAVEFLPQLVSHELEGIDRQLVQAHLEHCQGCRALALTLGWLGDLLPAMAELDPGDFFTQGVLARTTQATSPAEKAVRSGATIGPAGLMDSLGRWWEKQILRPQFALQFAYVATVLLVLLTALPISPLRGTPEKALEVMQAGPGTLPVVGESQQWVNGKVDRVLGLARSRWDNQWQGLSADLAARSRRSSQPRSEFSTHVKEAAERLGSGEFGEAGYELIQSARSGRSFWITWWLDQDGQTSQ